MQETQEMGVQDQGREDPWKRKWQSTTVFLPENSMDRGAWWARVVKSWMLLSNCTLISLDVSLNNSFI